ncbi:hypothetical protein D3C77_462900 [compost metagenome]
MQAHGESFWPSAAVPPMMLAAACCGHWVCACSMLKDRHWPKAAWPWPGWHAWTPAGWIRVWPRCSWKSPRMSIIRCVAITVLRLFSDRRKAPAPSRFRPWIRHWDISPIIARGCWVKTYATSPVAVRPAAWALPPRRSCRPRSAPVSMLSPSWPGWSRQCRAPTW